MSLLLSHLLECVREANCQALLATEEFFERRAEGWAFPSTEHLPSEWQQAFADLTSLGEDADDAQSELKELRARMAQFGED